MLELPIDRTKSYGVPRADCVSSVSCRGTAVSLFFLLACIGPAAPAAETVVSAALREKVGLVGLSALMTTTVGSMAETIAALRQSGYTGKIMVGGAVLTEAYAAQIGADYYARDAKAGADIAKQVLG